MVITRDEAENLWGISVSIDLYNCNPETIRSRSRIKEFVDSLISLIDMKSFGETQIVHFGEDEKVAGFSMTQLIETSLVSGHFANATNAAYLDVFSCKYFDGVKAGNFSKEFFGAEKMIIQSHRRI